MVGEAIAAVKREDVFLVSKVLPSNASFERTIKSCKQSLKRLNTDYLDLYLLHWPSGTHAIGETMRAMEKLVSDGLVRCIGVSNFGMEELKEAEVFAYASPRGFWLLSWCSIMDHLTNPCPKGEFDKHCFFTPNNAKCKTEK